MNPSTYREPGTAHPSLSQASLDCSAPGNRHLSWLKSPAARMLGCGWLISALVAILLTGCASPESSAYKAVGSTVYVVDSAMNTWGDYVRSGKATPAQEDAVRVLYGRYQQAMRGARAAIEFYHRGASTQNKTQLNRALDALDTERAALVQAIQSP